MNIINIWYKIILIMMWRLTRCKTRIEKLLSFKHTIKNNIELTMHVHVQLNRGQRSALYIGGAFNRIIKKRVVRVEDLLMRAYNTILNEREREKRRQENSQFCRVYTSRHFISSLDLNIALAFGCFIVVVVVVEIVDSLV